MLEIIEKGIHFSPGFAGNEIGKAIQIDPCTEVLRIVMDQNTHAMILGCLAHDGHALACERIGFGMKLHQAQITGQAPKAGCAIAGNGRQSAARQAKAFCAFGQLHGFELGCGLIKIAHHQSGILHLIERAVVRGCLQRLGYRATGVLGQFDDDFSAQSINHFKWTANPVKSHLHRVINVLRRAGNIRD